MKTPNNSNGHIYKGKSKINYGWEIFAEFEDSKPEEMGEYFIDQWKQDEQNQTLTALFRDDLKSDIDRMLINLPPLERLVTILYWGLWDAREPNSPTNIKRLYDIIMYRRSEKIELNERSQLYESIKYILSPEIYPILLLNINQVLKSKPSKWHSHNTDISSLELQSKVQNTLETLGEGSLQTIILFFDLRPLNKENMWITIASILWIKNTKWKISADHTKSKRESALRRIRTNHKRHWTLLEYGYISSQQTVVIKTPNETIPWDSPSQS